MVASARVSFLTAALAALLLGVAGCGSSGASGSAASSGTGAGSPVRSASSPSVSAQAPVGATASAGPVPARFAATSVTFSSPEEAWVLGTAPCAHAPCTSIVRTLDRGRSWVGLPAPSVAVGPPGQASPPAVWGIRFATPGHGFVFGDGLWETTDGGGHWIRDAQPGGSILSLAILGGQVLALTAPCAPGNCSRPAALERRALDGGSWTAVAKVTVGNLIDSTDLIATQAGVAAVVNGHDVLVTGDDGLTFSVSPVPCPALDQAPSVAVTSPHGLAVLCTGEGYTGHTLKQVYVSSDERGALGAGRGAEPGRRRGHHRRHRRRPAGHRHRKRGELAVLFGRRRVELADRVHRRGRRDGLGRPGLHHRDRRRGGARARQRRRQLHPAARAAAPHLRRRNDLAPGQLLTPGAQRVGVLLSR